MGVDEWVWPAYVGVIGGVAVFAVVFAPALVVQMRRYGSLSAPRLLGTAALAVYAVALVAYTLLPLPSGDLGAWCAAHGVDGAQLSPLGFVDDIRAGTDGMTPLAAARSRVVLQVVFNVALFVPLGMFVRRYLGRGVTVAVVASLALSVLIELTQYTGIYGLIGCSYRVADIDDVFANTLGGLLGALVAPVFLSWMPQSRELARARLRPRPVTVWRRWAGMLIDAFAFIALGAVAVICWRMLLLGLGEGVDDARWRWTEWALQYAVSWAVVFGLPPLWRTGASWGQHALWLVPVRRDGTPASIAARAARAWLVGGLWGAAQAVASAPGVAGPVGDAFGILAWALVAAAVLAVPVTRHHRGLSCLLTATGLSDARAGEERRDEAEAPA